MTAFPLIGEIRFWANARPMPDEWLLCDGSLYSIAQYTALFSIIGNIYGGDGRTSFGVPNLKARTIVGPGTGPGLPSFSIGQFGGVQSIAQSFINMPSHHHNIIHQDIQSVSVKAATDTATSATPVSDGYQASAEFTSGRPAIKPVRRYKNNPSPSSLVEVGGAFVDASLTIQDQGQAAPLPRENRQPNMAQAFYIAWDGEYPQRS